MKFKLLVIFLGLTLGFKAYSDTEYSYAKSIDETGRLTGFKSIVGFLDPEKDFILFSSWEIFNEAKGINDIKFYNSPTLKGASSIILNSTGVTLGDRQICFCGQVEVNRKREVKKILSVSQMCGKGYWRESYIYCPGKFPFFYGYNGYLGQYVLQFDEKVNDHVVRVEFEGKQYYADLTSFEKVDFRQSKNKKLQEEREKVSKILKNKSFEKYLNEFRQCLQGNPEKCTMEFINQKVFTKGTCESKEYPGYQYLYEGTNCFSLNDKYIKYLAESCLKNYQYPLIEKRSEINVWIYSETERVCVFDYIDGHWKFSSEEVLGC